MKILIAGDLVVNRPYDASKMIDKKLIELFAQSDYNIVNLEAPVTESENKALKTGPNLKSDKVSTLNVLKTLRIDAVTLANNHICDFGDKGIEDTLKFCRENNFATVGAGMNIREASKTLYINSDEGKIAIVNFAENEWSAAMTDSAGFNPMDIIDNTYQIKDARENADYVIVIIHGGHEYYNLPSPRMQKQYRFYAEQGANIVVGHHTHCISGYEIFKGVPIYYSLGNFLSIKDNLNPDWYTGLILKIKIRNNKLTSTLHTIEQTKGDFKLKLSNLRYIHDRINNLNEIISNHSLLQAHWKKLFECLSSRYLRIWSPFGTIRNKYFRKIISYFKFKSSKSILATQLNRLRSEVHRDLSIEIIKRELFKKYEISSKD